MLYLYCMEKEKIEGSKSDSLSSNNGAAKDEHSIRVWDIPTRLFHWTLVGLVICSFITGKIGISAMQYHEWSGVAILVLIVFRLVWGLIGGQQSRFRAFIKGPAAVIRYASTLLSKASKQHIGHNPLGGWSILAMLTSLFIQAGTGLFANDDILTEGPLYYLVSKNTSDWLTGVHRINQNVLAFLVAIHLGAIIFHLVVKRENLIKPMFTGRKTWENESDSAWGSPTLALVLVVMIAIAAYVVIY